VTVTSRVVTLAGTQFLLQNVPDATGVARVATKLVGWYDTPKMRTVFTPLPFASGSLYTPAYTDHRTITLDGVMFTRDRATLIRGRRALGGLCNDPSTLYTLRVDDEVGSLFCLVQRSTDILFKSADGVTADFSVSLTAPDPRLLDVVLQSATTQMAQPGNGGVPWNGPALVAAPALSLGATATTGGTFAAGAYFWKLTALNAKGETLASNEVTVTLAVNGTQVLNWAAVTGATGYRVYRGTVAGSENALVTTLGAVTTYTDTGTAGTTASPPTTNTATTGVRWNGPTGTTGIAWGQPGPTGIVTVDNTAGTAKADVLLTIQGPATNPTIITNAGTIVYGGVLSASDVLVINTGTGSVRLNGANRRNLLTRAGFFQIPAGKALGVSFSADLQNSTATMTAQWRTSYL